MITRLSLARLLTGRPSDHPRIPAAEAGPELARRNPHLVAGRPDRLGVHR